MGTGINVEINEEIDTRMNAEMKVIVSPARGNIVVLVVNEIIQHEELQENEILVNVDNFNDFLKPAWDGEKWTEGLPQEELDVIELEKFLESLKPSQKELDRAGMELLILNLLTEMEII